MEVPSVVNWILFNKALAIKMLIRYFTLIFPRCHFPASLFLLHFNRLPFSFFKQNKSYYRD